jgi:hypothetical protein
MAVIGALLAVGYTYEAAGDGRTQARDPESAAGHSGGAAGAGRWGPPMTVK